MSGGFYEIFSVQDLEGEGVYWSAYIDSSSIKLETSVVHWHDLELEENQ